jgi:hypothetical protein
MVDHPPENITSDNQSIVLVIDLVSFNCMMWRRRQWLETVAI